MRILLVRLGVCRHRGNGEVKGYDSADNRKRIQIQISYRRTERKQQSQVEDTLPHRECLWFYGTEHEGAVFKRSRNGKGKVLHLIH